METVFIFFILCLLAAPVILATGVALVVIMAGLAVVAAVTRVALVILAALLHPVRCGFNNRFSPVRRRHPRPAAWYQWR